MFYRGADIKSLNADEFRNNAIDGNMVPVVEVDFPDGVEVSDFRNQTIDNIEEYIVSRDEVPITGGLTDNLPAAIKFTKQRFPPGIVLHMDETNVAADVESIQYDPDWFDAHPGVLAHVTTLHDGELREDGRITALLDVRDDKTVLFETRRSEIENEGTASRVTTEREVVAFGEEIWLDDSITAMVMYRGTTGTSPYTLATSLYEAPGYRSKLGRVYDVEERKVVAGSEDYRKQAELLYEEVTPLIQYDGPLFIVAVESHNDIRSEDQRIEPDNFRFVYNGTGFDTDYQRNSNLLGWG